MGTASKHLTPTSGMQLISRAARIMRALADHAAGLTLSELAVTVGLPKSSAHRIVGALQAEQLVSPGANGKLRLGAGAAHLAAGARGALRDQLRPYLDRLARTTGETVDLAVLEDDAMRCIDQIPAPHRLRAVSVIGATFPLHCTANGKALLAVLSREQVATLLPPRLPALTPHTITTRSELWTELDRVRADGVAFDREEHHVGIVAVGAVVADAFGPLGAISIPTPTTRFVGRERELAAIVRTTCQEATRALGG